MRLWRGAFLVSVLSLASCYEVDVQVESDGSGTARIVINSPVGNDGAPLDPVPVRDAFSAPGVRVVSLDHLDVLDRRRVLIVLAFDRLESLEGASAFTGLDLSASRQDDELAISGRFQDPSPDSLRLPAFAGRPVRIGIKLPGLVRDANGAFTPSGRTVLWETTTDALATAPIAFEARSGQEFTQPGPGRASLALTCLVVIGIGLVAGRAVRGRYEPHAFLFAGGLTTLAYEVILTRLFSAVFWYHFAFMAISIALLGQGAGASIVTAIGPRGLHARGRARPLALTGLAIIAVLWMIVRHTHFAADSTTGFVLLFLLAALPFLFFGAGVARIYEEERSAAGGLYFSNMLGAAAGTLVAIPLLSYLGAETALLVVALLAGAAAAGLARGAWKVPALAVCGLFALLVTSNTHDGPLQLRTGKGGNPKMLDLRQWNSFSYVTISRQFGTSWALGKGFRGPRAESIGMEIDLNAFTPIPRWRGNVAEIEEVLGDVTALVHQVKRGGDVLIIGPGGGKDVLASLALGAKHVTAVEINPLIASMVRDRFRSFTGGLYTDPAVDLVVMNGRTFVDETDKKFDIIQASLVDTWAASASGAFALTENHLYTLDAFVSYLGKLKPGGVLSVSRWHHEPPRESLRLLALSMKALSHVGAREPLKHIAVSFAGGVATVLVCRDPIPPPLREAIAARSGELGFEHAFGGEEAGGQDPFRRLLAGGFSAVGDVPWDYSAPSDDRPFFFHTVKRRDYLRLPFEIFSGEATAIEEINAQAVWVVLRLLLVSTMAAGALILGPLALARRRLDAGASSVPLFYFSCLGLAFVFIVSGHIGRLSVRFGSPTHAFVTLTFTTLLGASAGAAMSPLLGRRSRALAFVVPAGLLGFAFLLGIPELRNPWLLGSLMLLQGVLLGILFPLGLEAIRGTAVVPWAFAANGALSVVGGSLSLALALLLGFQALLLVGVALYLVAASTYLVLARR